MNPVKTIKILEFAALVMILSLFLYSCEKDAHRLIEKGAASVKVNLTGVVSNSEEITSGTEALTKLASMNSLASKVPGERTDELIQTSTIPFSDNLVVLATLVPEDYYQVKGAGNGKPSLLASNAPVSSAASPVQKPLEQGVRYRVVVYDAEGIYVDSKVYAYGEEATSEGFVLDAGESYSFVAYSVNSKATLPDITGSSLASASINDVSESLMYFKKDLTLTHGENRLDIVLKHQFSQITTHIQLSSATVGNITSINSAVLNPMRENASIKLADGVITYGELNDSGAPVIFDGVGNGVRKVSSRPAVLIAPTTSTGTFNVGSITINGDTRDVEIKNLQINPGRRYHLNLEFMVPCTQETNVDANSLFDWAYADGERNVNDPPTFTVTAPAADYGFVLDFETVDNSFNMTINGKSLIGHATHASREIQFQTQNVDLSVYPQNIQFVDGAIWGINGTPQVYQMTGTPQKPVIRLVISATGEISMYGSKTSGGELFPLTLNQGFYFNNISWNKTGNNTVKVSQAVVGPTILKGSGSGRKIVPCTP